MKCLYIFFLLFVLCITHLQSSNYSKPTDIDGRKFYRPLSNETRLFLERSTTIFVAKDIPNFMRVIYMYKEENDCAEFSETSDLRAVSIYPGSSHDLFIPYRYDEIEVLITTNGLFQFSIIRDNEKSEIRIMLK